MGSVPYLKGRTHDGRVRVPCLAPFAAAIADAKGKLLHSKAATSQSRAEVLRMGTSIVVGPLSCSAELVSAVRAAQGAALIEVESLQEKAAGGGKLSRHDEGKLRRIHELISVTPELAVHYLEVRSHRCATAGNVTS